MKVKSVKNQIIYDGYHELRVVVEKEKPKKIFLVCASFIDPEFIKELDALNQTYVTFNEVTPNPVYEEIVKGVEVFNENACDFIISIGGGSVIDAAKAIKLFATMDHDILYLDQKFEENEIKHLSIPTTAGTGSESTQFSVIYYKGEKQSIAHNDLIPEYIILEPNTLRTLPDYQKKATIFDALSQAIESYWSVNSTDESKSYAREAIKLILDNMSQYFSNEYRGLSNMMKASNLSGKAINITQTTAAHAMSYKLTSLFGAAHGHSVAMCLPYVWEYMDAVIKDRNLDLLNDERGYLYLETTLLELSKLFGYSSSEEAVERFRRIYRKFELITPQSSDESIVVELTNSVNPIRLKNNPIFLTESALRKIYTDILNEQLFEEIPRKKKSFKIRIKSNIKHKMRKNEAFKDFLHARRVKYYQKGAGKLATDNKLILFNSYFGRSYACNPRAIYEQMMQDEKFNDYHFIWAFKHPYKYKYLQENKNTTVIKYGGNKYRNILGHAKYWIVNTRVPLYIFPRRDQIYLQCWHGTPLKRLGLDFENTHSALHSQKSYRDIFITESKKITYMISPSKFATEKFISGWKLNEYNPNKEKAILELGYPRNDILLNFTDENCRQIKRSLNIHGAKNKKIILYAPTWRDDQRDDAIGYTFEAKVDFDYLFEQLGEEYLILFKAHYLIANEFDFKKYEGFLYDVSNVDDINALYVISDMLLTDYSSVFFDYANLKRPIIFYMYDLEKYRDELRGFYLDLDELPGPIIKTGEALVDCIKDLAHGFTYDETYQKFNEKFSYLDDGSATQRVIDAIIEKDDKAVKNKQKLMDQIVQIQQDSTMILMEIKRICEHHDIKFYLSEGTLLGAVRHQGFIPWDDDVDVMMLREDYDRFIELVPKELPENLILQHHSTMKNYWSDIAKIRMVGDYDYHQPRVKNVTPHAGPFVDIFPLDYCAKDNLDALKSQKAEIKRIKRMLFYKSGYLTADTFEKKILKFKSKFVSFDRLHQKMEEAHRKFNTEDNDYVVNFASLYPVIKETFSKEIFDETINVPWGETTMPIVAAHHPMLTKIYGDYMKMPPLYQRIPKHKWQFKED